MQCLKLKERFLFCSRINISETSSIAGTDDKNNIVRILLATINSLYIFEFPQDKKETDPQFIEKYLKLKLNHDKYNLTKIENDSITYQYYNNYTKHQKEIQINFQGGTPKDTKDAVTNLANINILILIYGWQVASSKHNANEQYKKDKNERIEAPDKNLLFRIIENYILNNYKFIIDIIFLKLYQYKLFLKVFVNYIRLFPKLKFNILFDDEVTKRFEEIFTDRIEYSKMIPDKAEENNNNDAMSDQGSYRDNSAKKKKNGNFWNKQGSELNTFYAVEEWDITSTYLDDKKFELIFYPIFKYNKLKVIDLSNNNLTNSVLDLFSRPNDNNITLEYLYLANNNIVSSGWCKQLFNLVKHCFGLKYVDFSMTKIDNHFLNNFRKEAFNDLWIHIQNILNPNSDNNNSNNYEKFVMFDFRNTNINIEKVRTRFYLNTDYKSYNEIYHESFKGSKFYFILNNSSASYNSYFLKSKVFKIKQKKPNTDRNEDDKVESDQRKGKEERTDEKKEKGEGSVTHKNNSSERREYAKPGMEGNNMPMSINDKINNKTKENNVEENNDDDDVNNNNDDQNSDIGNQVNPTQTDIHQESMVFKDILEVYQKLFKYFFLIDYYFDPIWNSFNSYTCPIFKRFNEYNNNLIHDEKYNQIKQYIDDCRDGTAKIKQFSKDDAIQMYADYQNFIIKDKTTANEIMNDLLDSKDKIKDWDKFNPNAYVDDMHIFYKFLLYPQQFPIKIPWTTLNKFISRIKIESVLCSKEKDHYSLRFLKTIETGLHLSVHDMINNTLANWTLKADKISFGLQQVLNFEGRGKTRVKEEFMAETNNFWDVFLWEAEKINLQYDIVSVAKYVQYWRDNLLRGEWYTAFLSGKAGSEMLGKAMVDEFDPSYDKHKMYKVVKSIKNTNLPNVSCIDYCLHPSNLDYLHFAIVLKKEALQKDKEVLKEFIKFSTITTTNFTYWTRNLCDRVNFLFATTSRERKGIKNWYALHKNNKYLKILRILFRYYNALDFRILGTETAENWDNSVSRSPRHCKTSLINEFFSSLNNDVQESLDKIADESDYLRFEYNEEDDIMKQKEIKRNLLKYSTEIDYNLSLWDPKQFLSDEEQIENFNNWYLGFMHFGIFQLNIETADIFQFCESVQGFLEMFLHIKESTTIEQRTKDHLYLEILYQCFRFANRDGFNEHKGHNEIDLSFGMFYIICWYLDLSFSMIQKIKSVVYFLYARMNHTKYCKGVMHAIQNPYRYLNIMSFYEVYHKLWCKKMTVEVRFNFRKLTKDPNCLTDPDNAYVSELMEINETTTVRQWYDGILEKTEYFKNFKEKKLYWLYYIVDNQELSPKPAKAEDLIVQIFSNEILNRESNIFKTNEKGETIVIPGLYFEMRRRIMSSNIFRGDISVYSYYEQEMIFNHFKTLFYNWQAIDNNINFIWEEIEYALFFTKICKKIRSRLIKEHMKEFLQPPSDDEIKHMGNEKINIDDIIYHYEAKSDDEGENYNYGTIKAERNNTISEHQGKEDDDKSENENKNKNKSKDDKGRDKDKDDRSDNRSRMSRKSKKKENESKSKNDIDDDNENLVDISRFNTVKNQEDLKKIVIRDIVLDNNDLNISAEPYPENINTEIVYGSAISYPKTLTKSPQLYCENLFDKTKQKIKILSDASKVFFELWNQTNILCNIYEVVRIKTNECFPDRFNIAISPTEVDLIFIGKFKKFFSFNYTEIIKCVPTGIDEWLIVVNVYIYETEKNKEIYIKINSHHSRSIWEDIFSYSQWYWMENTKSIYIKRWEDGQIELVKYDFVYHLDPPFTQRAEYYPDYKGVIERDIDRMKRHKHDTTAYKEYKEEKDKKKKEDEELKKQIEQKEEDAHKKGTFNINKITNISKYEVPEEDEDSDESDSNDNKIVKLNQTVEIAKKEEINQSWINVNKNNLTEIQEDVKTEIKETAKDKEVKVKLSKEEEEKKKKLESNENKKKQAEESMMKAFDQINFDWDNFDDDADMF